MSNEIGRFTDTIPANADLSSYQFYGLTMNSSGRAALQAALTTPTIGVLQNKPTSQGEAAEYCYFGPCKAKIGAGGVTAGTSKIGCAATGKFVAVSSDKDRCNGYAMQTAVEDDIALIFFQPDTWLGV